VAVERRIEGDLVVVNATYRLGSAAWQQARSYYSHTETVGGIELAQAFCTRGTGLVVVAADPPGSAPIGALVVQIDGRAVRSLKQLAPLHPGKHALELRSRGERLEAPLLVR